jgi:hypothetical protein
MSLTTRCRARVIPCAAGFLACVLALPANEVHAQFYQVKAKDLNLIYYNRDQDYVMPHLVRCFTNSLNFHRRLFQYAPTEDIAVFLEDFDDYGYAGATSIPNNYLRLGIEPYKYIFDTAPTNERFNWVMNHELTHVVATDWASSTDRFYRSLFLGKVSPNADHPVSLLYSYLASPRHYAPRWYHEGIAVFLETWMSGGVGRTLGGYDEMVFRSMVRDSSYFYDIVGLQSEGTAIDFQVGVNAYLYGTRFLSYLAVTYGPEEILRWFSRTDDSRAYFSTQFENVFGLSLADAWSHWITFERGWQRKNLDSLRRYPVTRFREISPRALGSVSRPYYDNARRTIYAAINYPGQLSHIAALDVDRGMLTKVCDVTGPALYYVSSLAFDSSTHTMFFTTKNSHDWRNLESVDLTTGKTRTLIEDARIGDLAFNKKDRALWGVRHRNGKSTLVRIPPPYDEWFPLLTLEYGKDLFDIDIAPDGTSLSGSLLEISGRQTLVRAPIEELLKGHGAYEELMVFENNTSPEGFVFSPDGRHLFGSSYYTGVSNIFRYDLETKKQHVITNAETGFFLPLPVSGDSLVVFNYTGQGFVPVMLANRPIEDVSAIDYLGQEIVEKHPVVTTWKIPSPMSVNLDSLNVTSGEYNGFSHVGVESGYPIVEGYKDYTSPGVRLNFSDPFELHSLRLTASYSPAPTIPDDQRFHAQVKYHYSVWDLAGAYNTASFYDLFGPTKTSRKGYFGSVQYSDYLIYDRPRTMEYTLRFAGYGGLETLPDYQNIAASVDHYLSFTAGLAYKDTRRSLGAVDDEAGLTWDFSAQNKYVQSRVLSLLHTELDYGFLLPLDHSFIWLRTSFGYAFQERENPFANFFFGGFGNNWVDRQSEKRYRDYYSFPGVELNAIGGTNYAKGMLEWTLPPLRFNHFGIPALYLTWARLAFFTSVVVTNLESSPDRAELLNVGAQVDFRFVLFSRLDNTLSFGYAAALEQGRTPRREFMVSLKVF